MVCSIKIDSFAEEKYFLIPILTIMKSHTINNSKKKLIGSRPVRKGWTTLNNTNEIRLSDVKRMFIHIPNTGKTKQVLVNWE